MWRSRRRPFWRTFVASWAGIVLAVKAATRALHGDAGTALAWGAATAVAAGAAAWAFRVEARDTVGPAGSDARRRRRLPPRKVAFCVAVGVVVGVILALTIGRKTDSWIVLPVVLGTLMAAQLAWRWWAVGDPGLRWRDVRQRPDSWRDDMPPARTDQLLGALGAPGDESAGMRRPGAPEAADPTGASGDGVPGAQPGLGAVLAICAGGIVLTLGLAIEAAVTHDGGARVANNLVVAAVLAVAFAVVLRRRRSAP